MTAQPSKHVVFDVVGTCVDYSAFFAGVATQIGPALLAQNITPQIFGYAWVEASELEYTMLSISGRYVPFKTVFRALFYRVLHMSGIKNPREFANDEQRDKMMQTYEELEVRDGLAECFALLRENGWTVWCFTSGDVGRVRGYFLKSGIDMPLKNFTSCDTAGVSKPAREAYESVFKKLGEDDLKWFAAAHMWDVSGAREVGFRGAYCTALELEACEELFGGAMEVVADTLPEMARKIIAASG